MSVKTLEPLFLGIAEVMKGLNVTFEVLFIDDRGREESWIELKRLKGLFPERIKIIKLSKNFGQNGATLCGIGQASGEWIITLDDDLQTQPDQILELIACADEGNFDVVYGQPRNQKSNSLKKIGGRLLKSLFLNMDQGTDIGSSFRLIGPSIIPLLKQHSQDHLYINQVISWYTADIGIKEVAGGERGEGKTNYSLLKLIKIGLKLIFYYSSIPLRMLVYFAFICAILCFSMAGLYIYKKLTEGAMVGFTATIAAIFIVAGIILVSISVLGIYVNRIYNSRIKKPHYHIKLIK
jgi:glycosyltransferase involved in cell wall biosynthesis